MIQELNKKSKTFEVELLSNLFVREEQIPSILSRLSEKDFYYYGKAYQVVVNAYKENKNLIDELTSKGVFDSEYLTSDVSYRKAIDIADDIKAVSKTRHFLSLLESKIKTLSGDNINEQIADFQRTLAKTITGDSELSAIENVLAEYQEKRLEYEERFKNGDGIIGISTGYQKIDEVIDGFREEHLWVLGGYTNTGKTAASLNFVSNLVNQKKRVVYYSLEMSKNDIVSRLLGIMTDQSGLDILKGRAKDEKEIQSKYELLKESQMSIYNEKTNLSQLVGSMIEEHHTNKVDLFVIDFLQLITVNGAKSEYESVSTAILELQQLAKKLKTPIMVLSQISNDGARNQSDVVMSFKGSGSIAAAADFAIEINIGEEDRDEWKKKLKNNEPVKMIWNIRKNRHGRVGSVDMMFSGKTGRFLTEIDTF